MSGCLGAEATRTPLKDALHVSQVGLGTRELARTLTPTRSIWLSQSPAPKSQMRVSTQNPGCLVGYPGHPFSTRAKFIPRSTDPWPWLRLRREAAGCVLTAWLSVVDGKPCPLIAERRGL